MFLTAALSPLLTVAQSRIEPVVVTATRSSETLANTLRDVTVLDGDDLRDSGATDLAAALQRVPGVEVIVQGPGATPSIFIRGANSNHTLILIDGQRISSSFSGLTALQHVAIGQIDRVEIVRGAAASLYGADAVGGVIQIFTRNARGVSATLALGEARSIDATARAGFGDATQRFSISANHRSSGGYNAIVDPGNFGYNPDRDGYRFSSLQASANLKPSSALTFDANASIASGRTQYDASTDFDDRIKSHVRSANATATYAATSSWLSTLRIGDSKDQAEFTSSFPGNYSTQQTQASWQNNVTVSDAFSVWNVMEWRRESVSSSDLLTITSRNTTSAVIGANLVSGKFRVSPSLRLDDSDQFGSRTTAGISLGYTISPAWRISMNGGSSFKAPTFNDLYYPGFSNPLLAPEKGKSVEASLHWKGNAGGGSLTGYRNNVRDLIVFQCDADFNCSPQNVARAKLQGLTLALNSRIDRVNFDANLDLAKPENTTTGKWLPRRAHVHGALKLSGELFGFDSGVELIASGKRFDDAGNITRLGGYALANVYARRALTPNMNLGIRIDNALDRNYQQASGYATSGRRAWLTLSIDRP
jgi:vitamin B12 transporter